LETNGGAYQPGEGQLEGAGDILGGEMAGENLSEGDIEKQLDDETAGLESIAEWQLNSTKGDKYIMGDQVDLPTDKEEV